MAYDVAIVADGMATFLLLSLWQMEKPHFEITDDVVTVADGKATVWMADVVAIVADGIAT